tara:strand:+ start:353 stop:1633 length:1281 start_codon:yes stop_codon:yes gene_type:complete
MKSEENYTNKIVNNLKDYYKQNRLENLTNPSWEDKMRLLWINSPKKIIKNSWLNNFGYVNKRMSKKLDSLLFSVSNKLFFFESFVLIKNKLRLTHSNKNYYIENNQDKYSYLENGIKRELDYYGKTFSYEIIDYKEFLNHELGYKVISNGVLRFYLFSLGEKSYYFEELKTDIPRLNIIFDELILILNSQYSIKKNKDYQEIEEQRLKELQVSQTNVLSELDKDGNGEVDVVEGNDFNTLLKKHQKSIVEVDRNYVQQFVKVSSYLKTKKGNIQSIFNSIKDTPNQDVLNEYVEILKGEIHTYNLILFNSLNMIVSLVEDDMITFYEIHEMFDEINMFDSKHEKDVSQKLTNIGDGLESLMYKIRDMGNQISNSIEQLSYVTEQSNQQLQGQLSGIHSTLKVGNLISVINTYQNYKINKNTKSLRG